MLRLCSDRIITKGSYTETFDESTEYATDGIVFRWASEAGTMTQAKPTLQSRSMPLDKAYGLIPLTDELLDDSEGLESYVFDKLRVALPHWLNFHFLQGTGAGQPLGVLNSACTISVAKEGSQTANTVVAENLRKMVARLRVFDPSSVSWVCHPTAYRDIVEDLNQIPHWPGRDGQLTLFGYPVLVSQGCEEIGDLGDLFIGDWSMYRCVRKAPKIMSSMHLWFDQDATALKFVIRVAGQPKLTNPIPDRDGSSTTSPFVMLAERA